jgi:hypothetical protein
MPDTAKPGTCPHPASRPSKRESRRFPTGPAARIVLIGASLLVFMVPAGTLAGVGEKPPLRFTTSEARGPGRPLWRRWVDLDGDGLEDLVLVSGSTTRAAPAETGKLDDFTDYLGITPDFLDRRNVLVYHQTGAGIEAWGAPLPLSGDTAAVDLADVNGDGATDILYVAGFRLYAFIRGGGPAEPFSPQPQPVLDAPTLLGHTRTFTSGTTLAHQLASGRPVDLLLSTPAGLEIHRTRDSGGYGADPHSVLPNPLRAIRFRLEEVRLDEPAPRVVDADGDGTPDLLFQRGDTVAFLRGTGEGTFDADPIQVRLPSGRESNSRDDGDSEFEAPDTNDGDGMGLLSFSRQGLEDLDNDGLLDYARNAEREHDPASDGKPDDDDEEWSRTEFRIHRGRPGLHFEKSPDTRVALPHREKRETAMARSLRIDGDGRADLLVTRYSVGFFQMARAVMTKKISIDVAFESMFQKPDGTFTTPSGKPFVTKLLIDLKRGFSSATTGVRGDFDGDGRLDLIEFLDKPAAHIHMTLPDGTFPEDAAARIPIPRMPADGALTDIDDLNGDGRSDVAFLSGEGHGFVITLLRSSN